MDKSLIEQYKSEMLRMHRSTRVTAPPLENVPLTEQNTPPLSERTENDTMPQTNRPPNPTEQNSPLPDGSGYLVAIVSTLRALYPVPNAKVTVFTGNYDDMQVLATDTTDQSGRTGVFQLPAPAKILSQDAGVSQEPYSKYNMLVKAEGYVDNIHLNIPVFSGVTSLQRSNMLLLETAGEDKGPQIFDEDEQYNL